MFRIFTMVLVLFLLSILPVKAQYADTPQIDEAAKYYSLSNKNDRLQKIMQTGNFGYVRRNPFLPHQPPEAKAGATVISQSTGTVAWSFWMDDEQKAKAEALQRCQIDSGGATDCVTVASYYDGCGAYAIGSNGWAADTGRNITNAVAKSVQACNANSNDCRPLFYACSSHEALDYHDGPSFGELDLFQLRGSNNQLAGVVEQKRVGIRADMLPYYKWVEPSSPIRARCVYHIMGGPKIIVNLPNGGDNICIQMADWCSIFTSEKWRGGLTRSYPVNKPHIVDIPHHQCSIPLTALPHWIEDILRRKLN